MTQTHRHRLRAGRLPAPSDGEPAPGAHLPVHHLEVRHQSEHMGRLFDLEEAGYFYTRLQNPTNDAVAAKIAELEGGTRGHAHLLGPGGELLRGVQHRRLRATTWWPPPPSTAAPTTCSRTPWAAWGSSAPSSSPTAPTRSWRPPSAPTPRRLRRDHRQSGPGRARHRALRRGRPRATACRSSWTTPSPRRCMCRPIEWGADIVTHSTTKYMDGHGAPSAAPSWTAGRFDWTRMPTSSPASPRPTRAITASSTPSASAWRAPTSPRRRPSSCATSAPSSRRRTPSPQPGAGEPASAHGPALRERPGRGRVPGGPPEGGLGALSLACGRLRVRAGAEVPAGRHLRRGELRRAGGRAAAETFMKHLKLARSPPMWPTPAPACCTRPTPPTAR